MAKVYVGNLSYDENDESLIRMFQEFGEVESAEIVLYRKSGKSRGFGFVEMNQVDAGFAIDELNGKEVNGRVLKVNVSDPSSNDFEMENSEFSRIYVGNLTPETDVFFLANIFKDYGKITSAMTINDQESDETEGFGFIEMDSNDAAMKAIEELDGKEVDGIVLRVNWAKPKPKKSFRKRVSY